MKKIDIAYMAGFFDGEGSISIMRRAKGKPYWLRVQLGQANKWILQLIQFQFGGSLFHNRPRENRREAWQWSASANIAMGFLKCILPYLKLKKGEAEIAIHFQEGKIPRHEVLTEGEQAVEEAQRIMLGSLKDKSKY